MMPKELSIGVEGSGASISNLARFTRSIFWQDEAAANITLLLRTDAAFDREAYLKEVHRPPKARPHMEIRFVEQDARSASNHAHNILCGHAASKGDGLYIGADPDGIFHHRAISELIQVTENHPQNTLFEFMRFPDERPKTYDRDTGETAWCSRTSFAIAAQFFVAACGFDERLTTYEDVDLSWRVRLSGGRCVLVPTALFHQAASRIEVCAETGAERLLSGRALASKWNHPSFLEAIEAEMISAGVPFEDRHPEHGDVAVPPYRKEDIERVCDFSHGLHFSPTRW